MNLTPFFHHVLGNAGEVRARKTGHGHSFLAISASVDQRNPQPRIGIVPETFFHLLCFALPMRASQTSPPETRVAA